MGRLVLSSVCAICISNAALAEDVGMVETKRMNMTTAVQIAQGAVAACQEQGIQIGVTVVDRDGTPQVVLRDTIAAPITVPISKGKAYTAVMFNAATSALGDRANSPIGRVPGLVMSAGGLPVEVGGSLVGGVGVSGAPSGKTDEECAQAGIDAVLDDLEMAM
ncbi:MAG: heme-binding protein [Sedimenticola sp.]